MKTDFTKVDKWYVGRMCAEVPLSNQYKGIFIGKSHTISVNNEVENYFNLEE